MRWIWIDRILELDRGVRSVAIKNISLAEEVLHDHFPPASPLKPAGESLSLRGSPVPPRPADPVMPHTLIIEGMAQTAGILVGHARDFREKVILAKIGKAIFHGDALPGMTLRYTAHIDRIDDSGASTTGTVELLDPSKPGDATHLADIELMFSHIDQNMRGLAFPEHNFVFTGQFMDLLTRCGFPPPGGA